MRPTDDVSRVLSCAGGGLILNRIEHCLLHGKHLESCVKFLGSDSSFQSFETPQFSVVSSSSALRCPRQPADEDVSGGEMEGGEREKRGRRLPSFLPSTVRPTRLSVETSPQRRPADRIRFFSFILPGNSEPKGRTSKKTYCWTSIVATYNRRHTSGCSRCTCKAVNS